jgi:phosphate transport system substrate-binding protein
MRTNKTRLLLATAIIGVATSNHAGSITVKGSDSIVVLGQKWAEAYMKLHPDVKIQVTGGGSGIGLAALQNQTTDIAHASRRMKPAEIANCMKVFAGRRPTEYKVCLDGLSVYVHKENPVAELSRLQLEKIFTGKTRNWKEVGGPDLKINVYSRENSSGTYEFFKEHVLLGHDFSARAQTMPGTAALIQAVSKDKNAIGYGGFAYAAGAKILKIKPTDTGPAIAPSEETVLNQTYPIWRYCYVYVNPELDRGEVAEYIRWIRSDAGQAVVKEVGYFPIPENQRAK